MRGVQSSGSLKKVLARGEARSLPPPILMPSRTIHYLSIGCVALVAAYLALIAATLYFASIRSGLSADIRAGESAVATLETEYYDAIAHLSVDTYSTAGFVSPLAVEYVSEGGETAVTRADR